MISFLTADLTTIPRPDSPIERIANIGPVAMECTLPYKDKRTAKCTISMYSEAAGVLSSANPDRDKTLQIALRMRYCTPDGRKKCFHGPVLEPFYDFDAGTIEINAVGPEDRMAVAFIVAGDSQIDEGVPLDGPGFRELLGSAQNRPNQDALNWPSLGIVPGKDTADASNDFRKMDKGDEIWSSGFIELGNLLVAPDWEIEDIETEPETVASGSVTYGTDTALSPGVTDISLVSTLPGLVAQMRVGVRIYFSAPYTSKVELVHPDGTSTTLWRGTRVTQGTKPGPSGGEALGQGDTDSDLLFFADKGDLIYGTTLHPITALPLVGQYYTPGAPSGTFFEKTATGTWKLRLTVPSGQTGTFKYGTLRFQVPEPAYARLNTFNPESSTNPPIRAQFHQGFGLGNAKKINIRSIGSFVRNQAIIVSKKNIQAIGVDDNSRYWIGTRQMFESSNEFDDAAILDAVADSRVNEMAWPPLSVEIEPLIDIGQDNLPRALYDYRVGQHILCYAKAGNVLKRATVRVDSITLSQDKAGVDTSLAVSTSVAEDPV